MSLHNNLDEYVSAVGKTVPPVAVTSATVVGWSLQDWVLTATLIYTVLQTVHLIYKFFKDRRERRQDGR